MMILHLGGENFPTLSSHKKKKSGSKGKIQIHYFMLLVPQMKALSTRNIPKYLWSSIHYL